MQKQTKLATKFCFLGIKPIHHGRKIKGMQGCTPFFFVRHPCRQEAGREAGQRGRGRAGKSAGRGAAVPPGQGRGCTSRAGAAPLRSTMFGTLLRSVPLHGTLPFGHTANAESPPVKEPFRSTTLRKEPHKVALHAAAPPLQQQPHPCPCSTLAPLPASAPAHSLPLCPASLPAVSVYICELIYKCNHENACIFAARRGA